MTPSSARARQPCRVSNSWIAGARSRAWRRDSSSARSSTIVSPSASATVPMRCDVSRIRNRGCMKFRIRHKWRAIYNAPMNDTWTIYTDGGSRGNPGPAAYAYVIKRAGEVDVEEMGYLGHTTNNIAEYTGLVKALEHARELGGRTLIVKSDSELMVKQLNGQYKVKNAGLLPLYQQAMALRRQFEVVTIK